MTPTIKYWIVLASLLAAGSVILAAASSHGPLAQIAPDNAARLRAALNVLQFQSLGLLVVVICAGSFDDNLWWNVSRWMMLVGTSLFCGSLLLRVADVGPAMISKLAPIGGLTIIAGWLIFAIGALVRAGR